MGTPVLGVEGGTYPTKGTWQLSFGWRYQKSDKHYIGDVYQVERTIQGTQVINTLNLADLTLNYQASERVALSFGAPYFMGTRSQPLVAQGKVIDRYQTQAHGIGDVLFAARRWMLDPAKHPNSNIQLGVGVQVPTGQDNVIDTFKTYSAATNTVSTAIRTVDQSIQPGDGGFGVLVDLNAFKGLANGNLSLYLNGAYLSSPGGTNGVQTYRSAPGESVMSIADQYLLRGGASVLLPGVKNLSFSVGGRWEGVPARDVIGPSDGFRRPGYAVSIEPALTYYRGRNVYTLGVPFAVYRNRTVSVADQANGTHGDAAFADYLILASFARRF